MKAGSYKTRMSRLTSVFCVIALCNVETDIYNLNMYAFLVTTNLHTHRSHYREFTGQHTRGIWKVLSTLQYLSNRLTNPFMFGIILNSYRCSVLRNKFQKWRIAFTIMGEMSFFFHTFYRISYGKLNIQKFIELVYQLQMFNKKIISAFFKTRENAFIMRLKSA